MKYTVTALMLSGLMLLTGCTPVPVVNEEQLHQAAEQNTQLGLAYMRQSRYETALTKLHKAIKQNPENADAHHYLAELYRRLEKYKEAEQHYLEALELLPHDSLSSQVAALENNFGIFLCEQKRYQEAQQYFNKVLENPLYQYKDQLYENMGLCERNKGALHRAENYLLKALKINPKLPKSLLAMAQLSYDKQLYRQAGIYLNKYLTLAKHNSQSLWLGILLERRNNNTERVASYSVLLKGKFPDSKETLLLRKLEAQGRL